MIGQLSDSQVRLKRIFIESRLPAALQPLRELAHNLWWSWDAEASALFRSIDEAKFKALNYNPVALLDNLSVETAEQLANDKDFLARLRQANKEFQAYMAAKPAPNQPRIAYFSMEYGLHTSLRLYSGGLGVLAGDYLKEASDSNVDLLAVGLLYRYGYFNQAISLNGDQIHQFPPQEFTKLPISPVRDEQDEWLKVEVNLQDRTVHVKVWELKVGRVSLYLLDTDFEENSWEDRALTHQLYGGDNKHRLEQEILLGIGGIRALKALKVEADIYHCNEGHAAFLSLERLKNLVREEGLSFPEAVEVVKASSLFTTHTPVPAGHDHFPEHLLQAYLYNYTNDLGISWQDFMALGKINVEDKQEQFSMSHLAMRLSQEVNGVSKLHGLVSQKMFNILYPGYNPEELHISYVTNSVHYPTWIAREWNELFVKTFGEGFLRDQSNKTYWRKIHQVDDATIMDIRRRRKQVLLTYIRQRLQTDLTRRGANPRAIFDVLNNIDNDALVIGFARRFATYKRAHLLFTNRERLRQIVNNEEHPVMFVFAGKAHPADGGGQDFIRQIVNISKEPDFAGKVIFLEDYNMEMAKLLVQGVDIWLNTPTRPLEASGTSGMKAAMNGVVNFSVLDGWWAEGYRPEAGWALPLERTYDDQHLQNELDAETIYNMLETEIIPIYFDRNEQGISPVWVSYVKNIIAEVAPEFTMKRMLDDYYERFYNRLYESIRTLRAKDYAKAQDLAAWKQRVTDAWDQIHALEINAFDSANHPLPVGQAFEATIKLFLDGLQPEDVGVEVVFFKRLSDTELELRRVEPFKQVSASAGTATYTVKVTPQLAGVYEYGFRVFPKHPLLRHRQNLNLVHWV